MLLTPIFYGPDSHFDGSAKFHIEQQIARRQRSKEHLSHGQTLAVEQRVYPWLEDKPFPLAKNSRPWCPNFQGVYVFELLHVKIKT